MTVINKIRRFLMKHDPFLRSPKVSDNLFQPLEASTKDLSRPGASSLPQTEQTIKEINQS